MPKVIHHLIAKTAKEIALEAYESLAHDNEFHRQWPRRDVFVRRNWTMFVGDARNALMEILTGDFPDAMKEPIYEAFIIDGTQKSPGEGRPGIH